MDAAWKQAPVSITCPCPCRGIFVMRILRQFIEGAALLNGFMA
jgi:hypothetical protein